MPLRSLFGPKKDKDHNSTVKSAERGILTQPILPPGYYGQFPPTIHVHFTGLGTDRTTQYYCLIDSQKQPLYAITLWPGTGKHQLTLHSGPDRHSPALALGGVDKLFGGKHILALPSRSLEHLSNCLEYLEDADGVSGENWTFRVNVERDQHPELFEWRSTDNSKTQSGPSRRELVWMQGPHKEEVVGIWIAEPNIRPDGKVGSLQFCGSGATGVLEPYWTLVTIASLLKICQLHWTAKAASNRMVEAAGRLAALVLNLT